MTRYIVRRLLQTVPVLFGVSLLAFAIMHVVPGDPVRLIAGPDAPEFVVQRVRAELGLERPLYVQYWAFLSRALQGDLGRSLRSRAPVTAEILSRFPATLELTTVSMVLAVLVGIPLGLVAAVRRSSWIDYAATGASLSSLSMPIFWIAIVAIWLFSHHLDRHHQPPHALGHARRARPRVRDDGARQGRAAGGRGGQARADQRAHSRGDGGRPPVRLPPRG